MDIYTINEPVTERFKLSAAMELRSNFEIFLKLELAALPRGDDDLAVEMSLYFRPRDFDPKTDSRAQKISFDRMLRQGCLPVPVANPKKWDDVRQVFLESTDLSCGEACLATVLTAYCEVMIEMLLGGATFEAVVEEYGDEGRVGFYININKLGTYCARLPLIEAKKYFVINTR